MFLQKITSFNPARKHTIIPKAKSYKKAKSICTNFSILFRKYNTSSPTTGYIIFHMQDRITIIQPCLYLQSMYQFTNLSETYNNLLPSMVLLSAPLWNSKNPPVQGIYMKSMSPKDHSILPLFHNPYKGYLLPPPHLFH